LSGLSGSSGSDDDSGKSGHGSGKDDSGRDGSKDGGGSDDEAQAPPATTLEAPSLPSPTTSGEDD
jgi:hypothetical protein